MDCIYNVVGTPKLSKILKQLCDTYYFYTQVKVHGRKWESL